MMIPPTGEIAGFLKGPIRKQSKTRPKAKKLTAVEQFACVVWAFPRKEPGYKAVYPGTLHQKWCVEQERGRSPQRIGHSLRKLTQGLLTPHRPLLLLRRYPCSRRDEACSRAPSSAMFLLSPPYNSLWALLSSHI